MSLLQGVKRFGGNLLDVATRFGGQQFYPDANPEMDAAVNPEQAAILRKQYDRQFRAARQQALRGGATWASMNNEAAVMAQPEHETALARAVAIAEQLKQRRLADGRTAYIDNYIKSRTDITPQQRDALHSLPPEDAAKMITRLEFPDALDGAPGGNVHSVKELDNGNLAIVSNDGKVTDTGVKYNRHTAEMLTMGAYYNDPRMAGGRRERSFSEKYGEAAGTEQAAAEKTLPSTLQTTQNAIIRLTKLQQRVAKLPSGELVGETLKKFNSEMQEINSELVQNALEKIGQLKAQGVSLQPITERELAVLFETSAQIKNNPDANVRIIRRQVQALQTIEREVTRQLEWIDSGNPILSYRPSGYGEPANVPPPPRGARIVEE